jgi:hypothetical protein
MKPSCATEPFDRHIAVYLKGTFNTLSPSSPDPTEPGSTAR